MNRALAAVLLAVVGFIGAPVLAVAAPGEAGELASGPRVSDVIAWQSRDAVPTESVAAVEPTLVSAPTWTVFASPGLDRFGYDNPPDFARPPPVELTPHDYDALVNLTDPDEHIGRVRRVSSGLEVERSAPRVSVGALDDASAAALRAADDPASIFIKNKHLASAGGNHGKFASTSINEVQGWVAQGLRSDGVQFLPNQLDGTFRAVVPAGQVVGTKGVTLQLVDRQIHAQTGHSGGRAATGGRS